MSLNTNEILKITQQLQEATKNLHTAQEIVRGLENKLRSLVLEPVPLGSNGETSVQLSALLSPDKFPSHLSMADRIVTYVNASPTKDFKFQDIFGFVGGNEPYIRSLLSRMMKEKIIETRGWGLYGAVSENTSEKEERLKA